MVISNPKRGAPAEAPEHEADAAVQTTPAVFLIMLALANGELHGYGIMQDVQRITGGITKLGPGTLYRSIQRMLIDGLIEELDIALDDETDDERRRYYRLTSRGRNVARSQAQRLAVLVDTARDRRLLARKPGGRR
jgi:DNA-binding PadR family transcriptional regulator